VGAPSLFDDDGTLTVGEVSRRIERALRREFGDTPVWVRGEIRDIGRPATGHVHFNLLGTDGSGGERSLPVVLFASDRERVNRSLRAGGSAVRMEDGIEVRIRVELRWFAPRSQVSLRMLAIDPSFTLGQLAERRDLLLKRLAADGVLRAQERLPFPALPLRVGLVTSLGSAAHADVERTLRASGFGFEVVECDARVQGIDAERSLVAALRRVEAAGVDVVCLVRGGGARTDLAAFDTELVARAVAGLGVPVLTGIGHETDTSVADEVSWRRTATPTACADELVRVVRTFCTRRDEVLGRCLRAATAASRRAADRLERSAGRIEGSAGRHLRDSHRRVDAHAATLARRPVVVLEAAGAALAQRGARVAALDPARLQALGWSITRTADGRLVRAPADVAVGAVLHTTTAGGALVSRVEEVGS
jgi:exodeoxyribonuclease VII large subunit